MSLRADTSSFTRAAKSLNDAADRKVRLRVYKGIRQAATPLGKDVVDGLANDMPSGGGLAGLVREAQVSIRNATTGANPRIQISLRGARGSRGGKSMDLESLNQGTLRHPVRPRPSLPRESWTWTAQSVPSGAATRKFLAGAPKVRAQVLAELEAVAREVRA